MSKLTTNLLLIAKMTYYVPSSSFNMGSWCNTTEEDNSTIVSFPRPSTVDTYHHCGTSACLAGWSAICNIGEPNSFYDWPSYAKSLVNQDASLAEFLFGGYWTLSPINLATITVKDELQFARFRIYLSFLQFIQARPTRYVNLRHMEKLITLFNDIDRLSNLTIKYFDPEYILHTIKDYYGADIHLTSNEIQQINEFNPQTYIAKFAQSNQELPQSTLAD